jgi:hypothetical protein
LTEHRKKEKGRKRKKRGEKHFNFKYPFSCDSISPLHHIISKTLSKIIENVFLAPFGPSYSLAIYMT